MHNTFVHLVEHSPVLILDDGDRPVMTKTDILTQILSAGGKRVSIDQIHQRAL